VRCSYGTSDQSRCRSCDMSIYSHHSAEHRTCIHTFSSSSILASPQKVTAGSSDANPITALTQSPAIDVVGVGFQSGEISVYDIRADERMMRMFMEGGSVRALGFRNGARFPVICYHLSLNTSTSDGQPILASASSAGHIAIWDLNAGGRLIHIVRSAHDGAISAISWIPNQPILVSSGDDNSVKVHYFRASCDSLADSL
jgi:U3 small nucleolar RNA-associated protein 21